MKPLRTGTLGIALLALGVAGASAGGLGDRRSIKDGPYEKLFSWTGFYIGATAGAGSGESRFGESGISNPFDIDGFIAGATIGYNLQFNRNWVVGIEADLSRSGISGSFGPGNLGQPNGDDFGCGVAPGERCATDVNWFGTLRGRIGYAANNLLVYGTGGLAYGRVKSALEGQPTDGSATSVSDTNVGWAAGGGIEYAFAPNWSAKFEYLHVDLGWTARAAGTGVNPDSLRADAQFDLVRLGLNYRFGN